MNGSEKQIAWAMDIKAGFQACAEWLDRIEGKQQDGTRGLFEVKLCRALVSHINTIEDADWWIENRNTLDEIGFKRGARMWAPSVLPRQIMQDCMKAANWVPNQGMWLRIWDGSDYSKDLTH